MSLAIDCITVANHALEGTIDLEKFRQQWPIKSDTDDLLWRLMHEVDHYLVDIDIRLKEPDYGQHQIKIIKTLINDVMTKYKIDQGTGEGGR